MAERSATEKFYDFYERYMAAKGRKNPHLIKLYAISSIGQVNELVGREKSKDKNECAKVYARAQNS